MPRISDTGAMRLLGRAYGLGQQALPENLVEQLIEAADDVIETGQRIRSDPSRHELSLARLCNVMGEIARIKGEGDG